jgi:hypothetical protein
MAYYPDVTIVRPLTRIRRERLLPYPGEVVVRPGQEVSPVQVVVRGARADTFRILRAYKELGVAPEAVPVYLEVAEGAVIKKGTPLLRKRGPFGRSKRYTSPIDGVLHQVYNGCLILQPTPELVELRAMMQGVVTSIVSNRGAILESQGSLIQALWDSGYEGYGKICFVATQPEASLSESELTADIHGCIVVSGRIDSVTTLRHLEEGGARGLIAGGASAEVTQAAGAYSFPLFLTDGIGPSPMAEPIFRLLQQSEGREASLFSRDAERPGSRPEIVIPVKASAEADKGGSGPPAVAVGRLARILRAPYASQVGRVVGLHDTPRLTALGLRASGADVQLLGGEIVFVPYANLDLIV